MRRLFLAASVLALSATAVLAQDRNLSVTIYNSSQSLIEDVRTETLKAGRQRIEFKDVSPAIRSETVSLSAPGIGIVEQNFDYDLLSPDTLMAKAVGTQIKIVRMNPGGAQVTETATVLAVNDGVVLQIGDKIEVLRDDGVPTRVIFDRVPPNLRARPTLSVTVDAAQAGPRQTRLTYLTTGLGWKADYVALFDEKSGKLDLQGWVTLTNTSGTAYEAADVKLVAGRTQSAGYQPQRYQPQGGGRVIAAGTQSGQGQFGDYYIYPLPERTTIAQNQTKQVSFLDVLGAPAKKIYSFDRSGFSSDANTTSADVLLSFSTSLGVAAGSPLPEGIVRVYIRDTAGDPKFIGENTIPHTPRGSRLDVKTGEAFDVTLQPTVLSADKLSATRTRYSVKYVLANARNEPVTVTLRQNGLGRQAKIQKESLPSTVIDMDTLSWDVPIPANGETILTFTIDDGW